MDTSGDPALLEKLGDVYRRIREQLGKVIVGQSRLIESLLIGMF